MDRLQRAALITLLLEEMHRRGAGCTEAHAQKAVFLAQALVQVPLGYEFILCKHAPFSFDLRDELTSLRADGLLRLVPQWPGSPDLRPTGLRWRLWSDHGRTVGRLMAEISFVAGKLAGRRLAYLECLASALYVCMQGPGSTDQESARALLDRQPHLSMEQVQAALVELGRLLDEARGLVARRKVSEHEWIEGIAADTDTSGGPGAAGEGA